MFIGPPPRQFMKQNPSMVQMGLSLINKNNAVWKK